VSAIARSFRFGAYGTPGSPGCLRERLAGVKRGCYPGDAALGEARHRHIPETK
jgi:hypothetical protein